MYTELIRKYEELIEEESTDKFYEILIIAYFKFYLF
jgi:hypothetical protein